MVYEKPEVLSERVCSKSEKGLQRWPDASEKARTTTSPRIDEPKTQSPTSSVTPFNFSPNAILLQHKAVHPLSAVPLVSAR